MSNQTQSNNALIVSASPHIRDMESIPTNYVGSGTFFDSSRNRRCFYVWILLPVCCFFELHNGSYYRSIYFTVTKTPCFKRPERRQRRCYWNFIGIHTAAKCSLVCPCRGFFLCYRHCKARFRRVGKQYLESCPGSARFLTGGLSRRYQLRLAYFAQHGMQVICSFTI